jgi:hypothetical protein
LPLKGFELSTCLCISQICGMHLTATPQWQTLILKLNYISIATLIYANIIVTSCILRNKIAKNLKIFVKIDKIKCQGVLCQL